MAQEEDAGNVAEQEAAEQGDCAAEVGDVEHDDHREHETRGENVARHPFLREEVPQREWQRDNEPVDVAWTQRIQV